MLGTEKVIRPQNQKKKKGVIQKVTLLFKKPLNAQFLCTVCLYIDIRNRIDGLHIVLDMVKKRICKTVNRVEKITQQTAQREKKIEIQTRLRNREELYSTSHWSSRRKH